MWIIRNHSVLAESPNSLDRNVEVDLIKQEDKHQLRLERYFNNFSQIIPQPPTLREEERRGEESMIGRKTERK